MWDWGCRAFMPICAGGTQPLPATIIEHEGVTAIQQHSRVPVGPTDPNGHLKPAPELRRGNERTRANPYAVACNLGIRAKEGRFNLLISFADPLGLGQPLILIHHSVTGMWAPTRSQRQFCQTSSASSILASLPSFCLLWAPPPPHNGR